MSVLATSVLLKENGERILLESADALLLEQSYQGFPVLDFWPNWERLPSEYRRFSGTILDNTTGLPTVKPRGDTQRQEMDVLRFPRLTDSGRNTGRQQPRQHTGDRRRTDPPAQDRPAACQGNQSTAQQGN